MRSGSGQAFLEHAPDGGGVGLAAGGLHDRAHERTDGLHLAAAHLLRDVRVGLDRGVDGGDQLARQALDGVLAGEGGPAAVVESRGLAVMGESDELVAAVDAAIEANPDVAEKVRGGKVQAIGALVGAVMKTTRGKADAATVKRMLEERLS